MPIVFFDNPAQRPRFFPLAYSRPIADFRVGILTIREKWERFSKEHSFTLTEPYLQGKYPNTDSQNNIYLDGSIIPTPELMEICLNLNMDQAVFYKDTLIAVKSEKLFVDATDLIEGIHFAKIDIPFSPDQLTQLSDIFSLCGQEIGNDIKLFKSQSRELMPLPEHSICFGPVEGLFIEKGATILNSTFNTTDGPIYIAKDAVVMEGSKIRGPFALGNHSTLKMGAKIYGGTSIGPHCKVGGEVNNSVFFGYSNKGHDGFLGNSVLGEWCNIGADTNNSNLKNNYDDVKLWNYKDESFKQTYLQFCGLIMGDHSKCGINTMFNTGTVIGFNCNIFGTGFPTNFVPDFAWGGANGYTTYTLKKAIDTAKRVVSRRNIELSQDDLEIFESIFEQTTQYRFWE
jgi:UDP-N-acetylglucosamine diphosphorylase/glucosamine-1-phosphate N-acetyltransferase